VFSRTVTISPLHGSTLSAPPTLPGAPRNEKAQFLFLGGIGDPVYVWSSIHFAKELRQAKQPVDLVLILRGFQTRADDFRYLWRWLQASWTTPRTVERATAATAGSEPALTTEALAKMTTFWSRFSQAPDSIRQAARQAHQKEIVVSVPEEQAALRVVMTDLPALAAKYPRVAADLAAAGLTARQAEAYRLALISAATTIAARERRKLLGPRAIASLEPVRGWNVAFMLAHRNELKALGATGLWFTP
jgi:hypothetical protein